MLTNSPHISTQHNNNKNNIIYGKKLEERERERVACAVASSWHLKLVALTVSLTLHFGRFEDSFSCHESFSLPMTFQWRTLSKHHASPFSCTQWLNHGTVRQSSIDHQHSIGPFNANAWSRLIIGWRRHRTLDWFVDYVCDDVDWTMDGWLVWLVGRWAHSFRNDILMVWLTHACSYACHVPWIQWCCWCRLSIWRRAEWNDAAAMHLVAHLVVVVDVRSFDTRSSRSRSVHSLILSLLSFERPTGSRDQTWSNAHNFSRIDQIAQRSIGDWTNYTHTHIQNIWTHNR